ncbi:MAG: hypothetical protein GY816_16870 [Cytophagales bacterium]|nr:hypothetical protein [Cytophagales bacterium]
MIAFYHKVFYHLYKLAINTGEKSAPLTSAMPTITFLQFCNLMCIDILLEMIGFSPFSFMDNDPNSVYYVVGLLIGGLVANYLYFTSEGRYKAIAKEFEKKPLSERKKGARITLIYALVSIALIFILAPLRVM